MTDSDIQLDGRDSRSAGWRLHNRPHVKANEAQGSPAHGLLRKQRSTFRETLRLLKRIAPVFAASAILIIADGALAKGNGGGNHDHGQDHSDHSQMKSQDSKSDHSDKDSEKYKDKSGDMRSENHKDKDSKHAEKMKEKADDKHAEKPKDKDKDKTTTTGTTTTTTANGKTLTDIKPVPAAPAPRRHARSH